MDAPDPAATAPTLVQPHSAKLTAGLVFAGRYEVLGLLGQGGMGAVYRVRDTELDEEIALKTLRADVAEDELSLDRFRREVKLARRVTHPNVARTFDLGTHAGVRFLTMELIIGQPLSRIAKNHVNRDGMRLPFGEAVRVVTEIARGLAAAHAVGVVHRDLKPDNVMIAGPRTVITDFGIARLAEGAPGREHATVTSGGAIGTPAYMAPEQVEGKELDGRADIYSLGLLFYELLTGRLPFDGETAYSMAAARLTDRLLDPRQHDSRLPENVSLLVRDATARKREARPDAQALLDRLEAVRGFAEAPSAGALSRAEAAAPGGTLATPSLTPSQKPLSSATPIPISTGTRTLAVLPLEAQDSGSAALARDLSLALGDGLAAESSLRVLPPSSTTSVAQQHRRDGIVDGAAVGRALGADVVIEGSVRVAGDRARVRISFLEARSGVQSVAERIDGRTDDPFALEDALVAKARAVVRSKVNERAERRGPADPEARAVYRRGRGFYVRNARRDMEQAAAIFEDGLRRWPDDGWFMSGLGAALTRIWVLDGAKDREVIERAEDLALRALAQHPDIGETYATIGILRLNQGETRAAVRAFQEAVTRVPLLGEGHEYLGRLLCEAGRTEEGMRRLDLALRLEPESINARWERARTFALLGDHAEADAEITRATAVAGNELVGVYPRIRFALWWRDAAIAERVIRSVESAIDEPDAVAMRPLLPLLRAIAAGERISETLHYLRAFTNLESGSPRQRAFYWQLNAEFFCAAEQPAAALEAVERAAAFPLNDLLWFDRCGALAPLRDDAGFAKCRAAVAARVAEIFG